MLKKQNKTIHLPVLLEQTLSLLNPQKGESYLDLTAGYGGHAEKVLNITGTYKESVLVDRDAESVEELTKKFGQSGIHIMHTDFYSASSELNGLGRQFDIILADLGVSSLHLNKASRGFSIKREGPLDMRMDQSQQVTAGEIINAYSEKQLKRIIAEYGEDPKAAQIAHLIVSNRPINTTTQLANIVAKAWPGYHKIHPATRTFQAVRIAVNNEITMLSESMELFLNLLAPGGRIAIISFHSIEDRLVKQFFNNNSKKTYDAQLSLLTKKPIQSDIHELAFNPRARSAKLRAAVKIKTKKEGTRHAYTG